MGEILTLILLFAQPVRLLFSLPGWCQVSQHMLLARKSGHDMSENRTKINKTRISRTGWILRRIDVCYTLLILL